MGTDTTALELVFGCFLGLVRQFADVWALFDRELDRVKVIGPAASNPLWLQLKADLLGVPVSAAGVDEVVSRGAQALAHGIRRPWQSSLPHDVSPDAERHRRLRQGCVHRGPVGTPQGDADVIAAVSSERKAQR